MNKKDFFSKYLRPESVNFRHYFGGTAFLLLIVQLLTGIFMAMYYQPQLENAYKSVQTINNVVYGG
ncbi:MAG: cytochrome b, partial [Nitrospirae bacterium]|nr:cytochrome b [Nitrospirota bacterium]